MSPMIQRFVALPTPVKAVITLASGGGIVAAMFMLLQGNRSVLYVVIIGIAVIGAVLAAYGLVLKWLAKRKAAPMMRALTGNAAAAPQGINEPARRARLDDLRKNFETGVEKFRAAGKNIYSLPWYMLVGEPGSGKTEAIRHCNVGFPPGLQDQLQGAGGTINMNWWFTNHAVVLDTAGRLMFEEVEPGTTSEWQEFLKLLRRTRPNAPVNGMLLVIPAESLIRDTADALERKGGKIAQQLDQIQRAIGVRFPVFVIVTKCDLINGFREFFDELTDPQLQHQILGWSNPASLDDPFNPEQVDQHLRQVQQRLVRRRLGLLLDPVNTENPSAKRTDQVDALYAFPESLMKIAPRLRRYLEMIFVAGEWSAKPLFLRGIYFTSSMREGSALDAELAEALGMPVESLPEGRVWEKERAYFLRDLFLQKVFREKALVTRAGNTGRQQRQRTLVVAGTAGVGLALVALLTVLGWRSLGQAVGKPRDFWAKSWDAYKIGPTENFVGRTHGYLWPIVYHPGDDDKKFVYRSSKDDNKWLEEIPDVPDDRRRGGRFPLALQDQSKREIGIPWVFSPVALVLGDTGGFKVEQAEATGVLFETSVLNPVVDAALVRMKNDTDKHQWSPQADGALAQLIRVEAGGVAGSKEPKPVELAPLLAYTLDLSPDAFAKSDAGQDAPGLQDVVKWLYDKAKGGRAWPPAALKDSNGALIAQGVAEYVKSWEGVGGQAGRLGQVRDLINALVAFRDAEKRLQAVSGIQDAAEASKEWGTRLKAVQDEAKKIDEGVAVLAGRSLAEAYDQETEKYRALVRKSHADLLAEFSPVVGDDGKALGAVGGAGKDAAGRVDRLVDARALVDASLKQRTTDDGKAQEQRAERVKLDSLFLKGGTGEVMTYSARAKMYARADGQLRPGDAEHTVDLGRLKERLAAMDDALKAAKDDIERIGKTAQLPSSNAYAADGNALAGGAADVSGFALSLAGKERRAAMIGAWLGELPTSGDLMADKAAELSATNKWTLPRPSVPMTVAAQRGDKVFSEKFDSRAAAALLSDCTAISGALDAGAGGGPAKVARTQELAERSVRVKKAGDDYGELYLKYWSEGLLADLAVVDEPWSEFYPALKKNISANAFNDPLQDVAQVVSKAFEDVQGAVKSDKDDPASLKLQVETARKNFKRESFTPQCERVLNAWQSLGAEVGAARDAVLRDAAKPEFASQYVFLAPAGDADARLGDFVKKVWEDLTYKAIKSLARASEAQAMEAIRDLRAKSRFPLAPPAERQPSLTLDEVLAAQVDIRKIRAAGGAPGGGAAAAKVNSPKFDNELDRLRGMGVVPPDDRAWIDAVASVLEGLPKVAGETLLAKVSVAANDKLDPGDTDLADRWPEIAIKQQAENAPPPQAGDRVRNNPGNLAVLSYPGEGLSMFFFTANGRDDLTKRLAGPWSPLQLLFFCPEAQRDKADGRIWHARLDIPQPGGAVVGKLWLRIEFERVLPEKKDWPKPK